MNLENMPELKWEYRLFNDYLFHVLLILECIYYFKRRRNLIKINFQHILIKLSIMSFVFWLYVLKLPLQQQI
jgi:hypothetical protein